MRHSQAIVGFLAGASLLAAVLVGGSPARADLVAHYTFDGPLGTEDSAGTNNGTLQGARGGATVVVPPSQPGGMGALNTALYLDNPTVSFGDNGQHMSIASNSAFDFTDTMTVALWMYGLAPAGAKNNVRLVNRKVFPPNWSFQVSPSDFRLKTQNPNLVQTDPNVWTNDQWYHVAMVYDYSGTGTQKMYVNGVEKSSVTITGPLSVSSNEVTLGAPVDNNYATAYSFNGYLDDVRFYDTALSQAEIAALMTPAPPPAHWHMGDANHDLMVDLQDFGLLKINYGATSGATWEMGDFSGDGGIDLQDFGLLKLHYGHSGDANAVPVTASLGEPGQAVPEPATMGLLLGVAGLVRARRR